MKMEKLICECCGGTIDPVTMRCEYCGTAYRKEHEEVIRIETYRNPVQTITVAHPITDDMMRELGPRTCGEIALNHMANELSKALMPFVRVDTDFDSQHCVHQVRGTIKVIVPKND